MTEFIEKKRMAKSINFIEERINQQPDLALQLLEKFQRKSANHMFRTSRDILSGKEVASTLEK